VVLACDSAGRKVTGVVSLSTPHFQWRVKMDRPLDVEERRRYCMKEGDLFTGNTPPPWECPKGSNWAKTIFGDWFEREDNIPYCCDPSMERYWCM